jgi:hypothetical protein
VINNNNERPFFHPILAILQYPGEKRNIMADTQDSPAANGTGPAAAATTGRDPSGFLNEILHRPVTVKLNSGVVYKGTSTSLPGISNHRGFPLSLQRKGHFQLLFSCSSRRKLFTLRI